MSGGGETGSHLKQRKQHGMQCHSHQKKKNKLNNLIFKQAEQMKEGVVKFYNTLKGFGFITPAQGGEDVFVHSSGLFDEVRENDKVVFEVAQGKKGLNAVNVRRI